MLIPTPFDEKKFLEALLLDESRNAYEAMTKEQKKVVRLAYNYGHVHKWKEG